MRAKISSVAIVCALLLSAPLAACDNQEGQETAQQEPQAGEEALATAPEGTAGVSEGAPGAAISGDLAEDSSMGEESPAGEAVTEQELPQSDLPPPSREAFTDASCDFEAWVGQPVDEAAVKETGRVYRILKPDSMMTMDHNPERINVVHDDDGKVTRVWCG